jgi:hypothetical protein
MSEISHNVPMKQVAPDFINCDAKPSIPDLASFILPVIQAEVNTIG